MEAGNGFAKRAWGGTQSMKAWGALARHAAVDSGRGVRVGLSFRFKSGYRSEVCGCGSHRGKVQVGCQADGWAAV